MSATHAIGIDIGGTKIALALVNAAGSIARRLEFPTEFVANFHAAVERIAKSIDSLLAEASLPTTDLRGIGIGCAGPVDSARGLIRNPHTLPGWDGCDIVTPLRNRFNVPVFLENDADAALLGECFAGAGKRRDPVAMLTLGTGVGGATTRHARTDHGAGGQHPEIGHMLIVQDGPECYCGARGCLESLASGTAIAHAGRPLGFSDAAAVFAQASAGHAGAKQIIDTARAAVAIAAWNLCHIVLPQRLILGGGIMDHHYGLFAPIIEQRLRVATQFLPGSVDVARAALGNDAGLVGAASLAFAASITTNPAPRPNP